MRIKSLKIKNFKKLEIENMNLIPNMNNFEKNNKYFSDKNVIPKIIGITGANAMGKTSIIESMRLLRLFQSKEIFIYCAMTIIKEEKIKNYIDEIMDKEMISLSPSNGVYFSNFMDIITNDKKFKDFLLREEIKEVLLKANNLFYSNIHKNSARYSDKPIIIEVNLEFEKKDYSYILEIKNNGAFLTAKTIDSQELSSKHHMLDIFRKFQEKIIISGSTLKKLPPINIDNTLVNHFNESNLFKDKKRTNELLRDEITLSLLKITDNTIKDIYWNESKKGFYVKLQSGEEVSASSMSLGFKKMMQLISDIKRTEKTNGILFYDELENSFNQKIIDFLKDIIYNKFHFQLIFTSHSGLTLSRKMDNKQIFILENTYLPDEDNFGSYIWKFSSRFNTNHKFNSIYEKGIVASPNPIAFDKALEGIINEIDN